MEMPRISGYQFEKIIGKGAMSTVYLALQESLGRRVAIKVLSPGLAGDPIFSKRFIKEARIIGKLGHPHIVTIFDAGNLDDVYYIAMEYLEGGTLKERIKAGLTPDQAVTILCQIARALGRAHQQHCIHRDIKPANILFRNPDTALLSDFGIAKNTLDKTQLTAAGWRLGTPNYMSPEQALAKPTDARSDLYSLGVVFYEMLTGTRPFQGADAFDIALKHLKEPVPTLPEPLGRFQPAIDRLLAKEPEERFASAEELVEAVQTRWPGRRRRFRAHPSARRRPSPFATWSAFRFRPAPRRRGDGRCRGFWPDCWPDWRRCWSTGSGPRFRPRFPRS
ncbi:MAG: serine/threonine-protein kinase [Candidatus Competibacteraceae bacterium]